MKLKEILDEISLDISELKDLTNIDKIRDTIIDRIYEHEQFIYYYDADQYLMSEFKNCLSDIIDYASDMTDAYGINKNLMNSCILANLHVEQKLVNALNEINDDELLENIK